MKNKIIILLFLLTSIVTANNPYSQFGYDNSELETKMEELKNNKFILVNEDTNSDISALLFDFNLSKVSIIDKDGNEEERQIPEEMQLRWNSVDPLAKHQSQVSLSPYSSMGGNPIFYTDPDGRIIKASADNEKFQEKIESNVKLIVPNEHRNAIKFKNGIVDTKHLKDYLDDNDIDKEGNSTIATFYRIAIHKDLIEFRLTSGNSDLVDYNGENYEFRFYNLDPHNTNDYNQYEPAFTVPPYLMKTLPGFDENSAFTGNGSITVMINPLLTLENAESVAYQSLRSVMVDEFTHVRLLLLKRYKDRNINPDHLNDDNTVNKVYKYWFKNYLK